MRVPSIGLTSGERKIVAEGYAIAERMLAGYQDKPSAYATIGRFLSQLRMLMLARD